MSSESHSHILVGTKFTSGYTFTPECVDAFNMVVEENNPIHADRAYAETLPWKRLVISGLHLWKPVTNLFHKHFAPQFFASEQTARFRKSVYEGMTVQVILKCTERQSTNEAKLDFRIESERGGAYMTGTISARRALHLS